MAAAASPALVSTIKSNQSSTAVVSHPLVTLAWSLTHSLIHSFSQLVCQFVSAASSAAVLSEVHTASDITVGCVWLHWAHSLNPVLPTVCHHSLAVCFQSTLVHTSSGTFRSRVVQFCCSLPPPTAVVAAKNQPLFSSAKHDKLANCSSGSGHCCCRCSCCILVSQNIATAITEKSQLYSRHWSTLTGGSTLFELSLAKSLEDLE